MAEKEEQKGIKVPDFTGEAKKKAPAEEKKPAEKQPASAEADKIKQAIQKEFKKKKVGEKHQLLSDGTIPATKPKTAAKTAIKPGQDRVPTGIPGLDMVMGNGFEKDSVNIIGGGAGSGKSILCMQYLVNGATMFNEPGIYVTFEENKKKIIKHMSSFGWNLKELEEQNKLTILEYAPEQVGKLLEEGGGIIDNLIEKTGAKRMVFDSLTAFTMLHKDELGKIEASLALFKLLQKWSCTALLTAESDPDPEKHKSTIMEFEVDGVILLYNIRKGDTRERALEILKLRGIAHSTKIFPMKITEKGMEIFPEEEMF